MSWSCFVKEYKFLVKLKDDRVNGRPPPMFDPPFFSEVSICKFESYSSSESSSVMTLLSLSSSLEKSDAVLKLKVLLIKNESSFFADIFSFTNADILLYIFSL